MAGKSFLSGGLHSYWCNMSPASHGTHVCMRVCMQVEALRYDVYYDAGGSRNPAIDIGQIEGGAAQGLGHMLTEVVRYDINPAAGKDGKKGSGRRLTKSIMSYAIPDHRSIPRAINVHLFWKAGAAANPDPTDQRPPHSRAQPIDLMKRARAKTTGEPPLVMAVTLVMAARSAIQSLRQKLLGDCKQEDPDRFVPLSPPLTPLVVLEAIYGSKDIRVAAEASAGGA